MEEPRWALLGDTGAQAFFLDRKDVQRLPSGNYRSTDKICPYAKARPHALVETRHQPGSLRRNELQ
jgi:hypothetical protein